MTTEQIGFYIVEASVSVPGNPPGAPTLKLNLGVNAVTGSIDGLAQITQALPPPYGDYHFPVRGQVHQTGFGENAKLVSLTGQYVVSVPPPAIGSYLAHFSAAFAVKDDWNGTGTYTYGSHVISSCEITSS